MSGIDPALAAAINAAVSAADSAIAEAALNLGADAAALQAQISTGDLLPAIILPPQNGHDVIQLLGHTVAAQLPPDVRPGETIVLQVTGFSGTQILVRNLGVLDPNDPVSFARIQLPEPADPAAPKQSATLTAPRPGDPPVRVPAAPPREVFVAASVRPATPGRAPGTLEARVAASLQQPRPAPSPLSHAARTVSDVLRASRLPDTAFTRTVAAISQQAPQRLLPVLQRLEQALATLAGEPRAETLRTIAGFVSRLNLGNAETLPSQIASFVSHVVEGAEKKITQLLAAQKAVHAQPEVHTAAQGRVVLRAAELDHDLKTLILSLLRQPPAGRTPTLAQALNESLVTLAGTQLHVIGANAQSAGTITLPLPAFFHEHGKPAYVRISRDGGSSGEKLDADNFHVAFVLDTAHLGTVAIDVQTSSRVVNVDVKTEHAAAASALGDSLGSLRERLETLRYRVASAKAGTLKPAAQPARRVPNRFNVDAQA